MGDVMNFFNTGDIVAIGASTYFTKKQNLEEL